MNEALIAIEQSPKGREMKKTHKVLMLVENVPVPADRRVWPEALALYEQGFEVSVISPKGIDQYQESYCCISGIHIYRYRIPEVKNPFIAYLLEYSIAFVMTFLLSLKVWYRHGFAVIHAAHPPDIFFLLALFYRPFGKKFIFDQHDPSPELFQVKFRHHLPPLYRLLLFLEWCSYRTAQLVVTSNQSQKYFAITRGHCRPDQVFVVRNGPNLKHMRSVAFEPQLKRGRPYLLGYVGLMEVQDGVENCLLALHELIYKRGRRDVSLVLMGDGSQFARLNEQAHELELDEYVTFTGFAQLDDVLRYLTAADIGLIPDPQNGMNEYCTMIKTMEYMAMGLPIVAFDLTETRYSAQDAGLYARPNSIEDFADRIETLLDDEELRLRMGEIGRRRVEEELQWSETRKNLFLAYETLFSSDVSTDKTSTQPEARELTGV